MRGGAVRVQQGTRWTGSAQVGRGKAEESKVAAAPTMKQTLPQEPAPFRRPHPTPERTGPLIAQFFPPPPPGLMRQCSFDRATEFNCRASF